jgi:hypothetical protein
MFPDDVLDDHINLANDLIASEHNWPWDGQVAATIPIVDGALVWPDGLSRFRTIRSMYYNDIEIHEISPSDLMSQYALAPIGSPSTWADVGYNDSAAGRSILVRPKPAIEPATVLVVFYAETIPLVDDDDRPLMPRQFSGSIIAKAAELLSYREDNRAAAEAHAREYSMWLGRMRKSLRRSTGPTTPRVREGSWI